MSLKEFMEWQYFDLWRAEKIEDEKDDDAL